MAFCKLFTVLVLIHNVGGLLGAEVRSSIVGGEDAPKGVWPWMVHLIVSTDGIKKYRCGGTILSSQLVLTSASCWDRHPKPDPSRSMAWVGSQDLAKGAVRYMGLVFHMSHPEYRAYDGGSVNDLGLVKLKKKLLFSESKLVAPVKLPRPDDVFDQTSECWITGWGAVENGVPLPPPETLQQLRIPILPQSVCKAKYPHLTSEQLCAGDLAGDKDACKGDYGGPLVCRTARGFVQVGIMSYGSPDGCGLPGRPGVYTRVSSFVDYINSYINITEEASAEV
ncbi:tryptase-2-like [Labrus mixtus]|uniref:tryptase-2-like n=1 Tax=Labrus mixtus TaxID=508554 RepID=UPI0029BFFB04|nr:tryptase-2-like [Labrus mixtus]